MHQKLQKDLVLLIDMYHHDENISSLHILQIRNRDKRDISKSKMITMTRGDTRDQPNVLY